jgi:hypothetical protein
MRLTIISSALLAAGCAGTPTADNTQAVNRVCGLDDCFYERDVRDFEVIEHTTLIVYVGNERCPYRIELHGTFCDLAYAPELYFDSPSELIQDNDRNTFGGTSTSRLHDLRICRNDINIGVSGGVLTDNPTTNPPTGRNGNQRSDCQISSVESLTDDKLIELYVRRGVVAPPPPMGPGQIQVGDQKSGNAAQSPAESQNDTPAPGTAEQGTAPTTSQFEAAAVDAAGPR